MNKYNICAYCAYMYILCIFAHGADKFLYHLGDFPKPDFWYMMHKKLSNREIIGV